MAMTEEEKKTQKERDEAYVKTYGRPPKYKKAAEMQVKIEEYFKMCEGEMLLKPDGQPMTNKKGIIYRIKPRPPTVTGLALHLGFTSRQALLNYRGKKEFLDTVTRARSRIEQYNEEALYSKETCNGAKFNLSNNFDGWAEKQQVTTEGATCGVIMLPTVAEGLTTPKDDGEDE